jgi:NAD(P)-dependent dehydrogenase (short-subunit alcohol dehydrogenase family)
MPTVLVSGASSDIGLPVCRRYLVAGWRVIGHFRRRRPELDALTGPNLETWQADFADLEELERELHDNLAFFTRADSFINLAAAMPPRSFEAATATDIISTLSINLVPGLLIMQAIGPAMTQRKWGRIVHASSIGVKFGGGSESFVYSLSKHAQEFIPRSARAWAAQGVLVNVVRVGVTATRAHENFPAKLREERIAKIPMRRAATPEEMAETFFWLGSEQNSFMSGEIVTVAGGE